MARVPLEITPNVPVASAPPEDYERIQSSPADFGGLIGQAESKFGAEAGQAANDLSQIALMKQQRFNEVTGDEAMNNFMTQGDQLTYGSPGDPTAPKGLYQLRGAEALSAGPRVATSMAVLRDEIRNGLPNDAVKLQFDEQSRRYYQYKSAEIARHLDQQADVYASAVNESGIAVSAAHAAYTYNSDPAIANALADAQGFADKNTGIRYGASPDKNIIEQNQIAARTRVIRDVVAAAVGSDPTYGPARAQQILQKFGKLIDPTAFEQMSRATKTDADRIFDLNYTRSLFQNPPARSGTPFTPKSLPAGVTLNEDAMVRTVAGEAGAEPLVGQRAVASVIMNRANSSGASPRDVVFAPNQFEPWNGGAARARLEAMDPSSPQYQAILNNVVRPVMAGRVADPTGGATHFYAPAAQAQLGREPPAWATGVPTVIGGHNFYKVGYGPGSAPHADIGNGLAASPISGGAPADAAFPDEEAIVQKVLADIPDPVRQSKIVADVRNQISLARLATQTDRDDLVHALPDIQAAALGGQDVVIPEDRIRHLLPPADAAREIESLRIAQAAGQVFKSIKWASPQEVATAYGDLSSGMGPISSMIRSRTSSIGAPTGAPATPDQESPEAYRLRTSILHEFQQQVAARQEALASDPMGYIANNPVVQQKAAAIDPNNPETAQEYWRSALSVQSALGVAPYNQHILTRQQAAADVGKLIHADPATVDVGAELAKLAQFYGPMWPQAFGDMVTLGKLPPNYQTLAQIPAPTTRWDFQQMLRLADEKGGFQKLHDAAGPENMRQINQDIDSDTGLINFRRTVAIPGVYSNTEGYTAVKDSIVNLAAFYSYNGMTPAAALSKASLGILDAKYDFDGTMRTPKGMMGVVQSAADQVVSQLRPADLAPIARDTQATETGPGLTEEERQKTTLQAAQQGHWVPNENDTGLYLVGQDAEGRMHLIQRANGSRIELLFANLPNVPVAPTATVPSGGLLSTVPQQ